MTVTGIVRVVVDSSKRVSGSVVDFKFDASAVFTQATLKENLPYMCVLESISTVSYSEHSATYAVHALQPKFLLLTCPQLRASNAYESWQAGGTSTIVTPLQSACTTGGSGVYAACADLPYARTKHLGTIIEDDTLNKNGRLSFKLYQGFNTGNPLITPCATPNDTTVWAKDFSFTLVFFPTSVPKPERPIQPYYDFHKLYLSTTDRYNRLSTYANNCMVPVKYTTHGAMNIFRGQWYMVVEFVSPIVHYYTDAATLPAAIYLASDSFLQANTSNSRHLCALNRKNRPNEIAVYGQKYSMKPASRDMIGVEISTPLENMSFINLKLVDASGALVDASKIEDFFVCLTVFRHY